MDKCIKEASETDHSADEHTEDEQIARALELEDQLAAKQKRLKESVERLQQELELNSKSLSILEGSLFQSKISELQSSISESPASTISTIGQSQNLSEERCEIDSAANFGQLDNIAAELAEVIRKQSVNISNITKSCEPLLEAQKILHIESIPDPHTPLVSSEDEIKVHDTSDAGSDTNSEIIDVGSISKGKEAENPKFRYKKRSKTDVTSPKSLRKESPVESSKEPSGTPQSKSVDQKCQKPSTSDISTLENHDIKQTSDKNCSRTSGYVKSHGNFSGKEVDSIVPKKRKINDAERPSRQCPSLTSILSNTKNESLELVQFMDPFQTAVFYESEESSLTSGSADVVPSEGEQSVPSSWDVSPSEKDESSLASVSEDESSKS